MNLIIILTLTPNFSDPEFLLYAVAGESGIAIARPKRAKIQLKSRYNSFCGTAKIFLRINKIILLPSDRSRP
ncbi:MAG: hypothetical protein ACI82A_001779 [Candidatus Azotimanducaceae bacterium]|jgi:hypothetical protein